MVRILALALATSIPAAPAQAGNAIFGKIHGTLRAAAKTPPARATGAPRERTAGPLRRSPRPRRRCTTGTKTRPQPHGPDCRARHAGPL